MTGAAVGSYGEGSLAIVATAAGLAFLHFGHADAATDRTGVMTTFTAVSFAIDVGIVAEDRIALFNPVGDCAGDATMALTTVFLGCNAKCLFAVVAGAAGCTLLHLCHRVATFL